MHSPATRLQPGPQQSLLQLDVPFQLDIRRRRADQDCECPGLSDPVHLSFVIERKGVSVKFNGDYFRFPRVERGFGEAFEFFDGTREECLLVCDVNLRHFPSFNCSDVGNLVADRELSLRCQLCGLQIAIVELGVRQSESKGEEGVDLFDFIPSITDKYTLTQTSANPGSCVFLLTSL